MLSQNSVSSIFVLVRDTVPAFFLLVGAWSVIHMHNQKSNSQTHSRMIRPVIHNVPVSVTRLLSFSIHWGMRTEAHTCYTDFTLYCVTSVYHGTIRHGYLTFYIESDRSDMSWMCVSLGVVSQEG